MSNLTDTKSPEELNNEKLEKVSGGGPAPGTFTYAFSINQVVYDSAGWVLTIIGLAGWDTYNDCPKYNCRINSFSGGYHGLYEVNDTIILIESQLHS